jgi:hypothetical protein
MYVESFDECCGLLWAAKKYNLPEGLRNQCRAYLWANIYPNNVWHCLDFALENDEPELYQTALQVKLEHASLNNSGLTVARKRV